MLKMQVSFVNEEPDLWHLNYRKKIIYCQTEVCNLNGDFIVVLHYFMHNKVYNYAKNDPA
jgi:hypothetical protein